ncbi:MAG: hypothetical protein HY248_01805, partial [Fimbriimonas ginsengisoli]|nr:hypothetical protein [Fimbriimonas ginsengisoli]
MPQRSRKAAAAERAYVLAKWPMCQIERGQLPRRALLMKPRFLPLVLLVAFSATNVFVVPAEACWRRRCRRCHCPCPHFQDAIKLSWKFEKGKPFYQRMTTTSQNTMKVMGMDVTQNQSQTFYFSWTPREQDQEGNWIIEQKIEGIKMDIEIAGSKISYDSSQDSTDSNPLLEFLKAKVGSVFKLTVSKDMKVIKMEGRDQFEPLLQQVHGDDALNQMSDSILAVVPTTPVKKGQTWERKKILNMGAIGSYAITNRYTYEGKEGKLDKINVDSTLAYELPGPSTSVNLPFKIEEGTTLST